MRRPESASSWRFRTFSVAGRPRAAPSGTPRPRPASRRAGCGGRRRRRASRRASNVASYSSDEARLVEVAAARVGAADPLALGAPLPAADRRVVEPEVLVDAEVALPRLGARLREEEHLLVVLVAPVDDELVDDVGLPLLLRLHVAERLPVAGVALPLVDGRDDLRELRRARARAAGRGEEGGERARGRRGGGAWRAHPTWCMAVTGCRRAARQRGEDGRDDGDRGEERATSPAMRARVEQEA